MAAAISPVVAYNDPTIAASPAVKTQLLNQVQANQYLVMNQLHANYLLLFDHRQQGPSFEPAAG